MIEWHPDPLHLLISERVLRDAQLPDHLRDFLEPARGRSLENTSRTTALVAYTSDVFHDFSEKGRGFLRDMISDQTRYLLVEEEEETPTPALMWLPSLLRLRRPEQRLHLTGDLQCVRRLLLSQYRDNPIEGIVHAYILEDSLYVILGDLRLESIPIHVIPKLRNLEAARQTSFTIDPDGAYIHFPSPDLHYGASQLLELIHPEWRAEKEIERISRDWAGPALEEWRKELGLRQTDIGGLSDRQIRRIERQVSALTLDSAKRFSEAFGYRLSEFLDELATRTRRMRERERGTAEEDTDVRHPIVETIDLAA